MRAGGGGTGGGCVHSDGAYWFLQDQWKIYVRILMVSIMIGVLCQFSLQTLQYSRKNLKKLQFIFKFSTNFA
jgi:hypothetical protein